MPDDFGDPPEGWAVSPLKDVVNLVKDRIHPSAMPDSPYVGLEHVESHSMRLLGHGRAADVKSTKTRFRAGDVLFGKLRPYLNKVAQPEFDGICSTDFLVLRESDALDAGFIAQYLNQLWVANRAHHLSAGVELPRVSWASLSEFPLAYPPDKSIQRSIVRRVKQARRLSKAGAARVTTARRLIQVLRLGVLDAACAGRLTLDWREQYPKASAEEVISYIETERQSALGGKPKDPVRIASQGLPEIPSSWAWASVDSLASRVTDGEHKTPTYTKSGIPFVTVRNLTAGPGISFRNTKYISEKEHERFSRRIKPQAGDLLISKDGTIGVTRAVCTDRSFSIFVSVALVRPVLRNMTDYLELALSSPPVQRQMVGVGSGLQHLVIRDLKADGVPVPPFEEQAEIVRRVKNYFDVLDTLEERISRACDRIEALGRSVLERAFRGDLDGTN